MIQVAAEVNDATALRQLVAAENTLGRSTLTIVGDPTARSAARISRDSCESAADPFGLGARSGSYIEATPTAVLQVGDRVSVVKASASLVPELLRSQVAVGSDVTGLPPGARINLRTSEYGVVRAVVLRRRAEATLLNSSLIVPLSMTDATAPRCVVEFDPWTNASSKADAVLASLSSSGPLLVSETAGSSLSVDPVTQYEDRQLRWLWVIASALGVVVALILNRLRSGELATYRLSGTSKRDLCLLLVIEQCFAGGALVCSGLVTLMVVQHQVISIEPIALRLYASGSLWVAASALLVPILQSRNVMAQARDR